MHRYDQCVEMIKSQQDVSSAREWLQAAGNDYGVIHELSHHDSLEIVEEAYNRGAISVEVIGVLSEEFCDCSVDMLLLTLPENTLLRDELFALEASVAKITGFEPSIDEGQKYILLRWT